MVCGLLWWRDGDPLFDDDFKVKLFTGQVLRFKPYGADWGLYRDAIPNPIPYIFQCLLVGNL